MIVETQRRHCERSSSSSAIPSNYSLRCSFSLKRRSYVWWKRPSHGAQLVRVQVRARVREKALELSAAGPALLSGVLDAAILVADQWSAGRAWDMAVSSHRGLLGTAF
jgi:hypothetical protein